MMMKMAKKRMNNTYVDAVILGDCCEVLQRRTFPYVDLIFTSPPYEDARLNCGEEVG